MDVGKVFHASSDFIFSLLANLVSQMLGKEIGKVNLEDIIKGLKNLQPIIAKGKRDEALHGIALSRLPPALQKSLETHFLPKLGTNQRRTFILTIAQKCLEPDGVEATTNFLTRLARAKDFETMKQMAVSRQYILANEDDYFTTRGMKFLADLGTALTNHLPSSEQLRASADHVNESLRNTNNQLLDFKRRLRR